LSIWCWPNTQSTLQRNCVEIEIQKREREHEHNVKGVNHTMWFLLFTTNSDKIFSLNLKWKCFAHHWQLFLSIRNAWKLSLWLGNLHLWKELLVATIETVPNKFQKIKWVYFV
jgi:hypothetical protein